jgi:carbon storage regulator
MVVFGLFWPFGSRATGTMLVVRTLVNAMLVLSRKVGEKILIGNNISVTVVRVGQGAVRIGVEAPQDLAIVREEIKDTAKVDTAKVDTVAAATVAADTAAAECSDASESEITASS